MGKDMIIRIYPDFESFIYLSQYLAQRANFHGLIIDIYYQLKKRISVIIILIYATKFIYLIAYLLLD